MCNHCNKSVVAVGVRVTIARVVSWTDTKRAPDVSRRSSDVVVCQTDEYVCLSSVSKPPGAQTCRLPILAPASCPVPTLTPKIGLRSFRRALSFSRRARSCRRCRALYRWREGGQSPLLARFRFFSGHRFTGKTS